jgi:cell division protein FtsB
LGQRDAVSSREAGEQVVLMTTLLTDAAGHTEEGNVHGSMPMQTENTMPGENAASAGVPGEEKASGEKEAVVLVDMREREVRRGDADSVKKKRRRGRSRTRQTSAALGSAVTEQESAAEYVLQYTCQLLKSQALDYEVRGREMEEKNAAQAKAIEAMGAKVRAMKRRLHELQYEDASTTQVTLATDYVGINHSSPSNSVGGSSAAASVGPIDATDSLIPVSAAQIEEKVQQLIRERTQKLAEFAQGLPSAFKETLEQQIARLVDEDRSFR